MKSKDYLLAEWRDNSINPAEDFFQYANGGWLKDNPVPKDRSSWGAFSEIQKNNEKIIHTILKKCPEETENNFDYRMISHAYYMSAMNTHHIETEDIKPLSHLHKAIFSANTIDEIRSVCAQLHLHGIRVFFGIDFSADFDNSSIYLPYLEQGGLGLPERDYYFREDSTSINIQRAYVRHIAQQLQNYGISKESAVLHAKAIYSFESTLAQASLPAEELRDVTRTLHRYSVIKTAELMPRLNLRKLLEELGVTSKSVNIDHPPFFKILDDTLSNTSMDTIRHYLLWHIIRTYASALPLRFDREAFHFYGKRLSGQQRQKTRWKRVLDSASKDIGDAIGHIYVNVAFSEHAKARCQHMVDQLFLAMERSIRTLDWMTPQTKEAAVRKLHKFGYKIGYPDQWKDYTGITINAQEPYITNRIQSRKFEFNRNIQRLHLPVDRGEWEMPAHVVNAYYHPLLNEIVFPAGILQAPFFYDNAPDSVNYGAIGVVIGHEITHGFDDQGSRFDGDGHFKLWWTNKDRLEFERRTRVLVEQFNTYSIDGDNHVNGALTLGENIADLGGLTIAYDALAHATHPNVLTNSDKRTFFLSFATVWRTNYTKEYLHYITKTDPHSPAQYRCNGTVCNMQEFIDAFETTKSASLYRPPSSRAKIW